MSDEELVIIVQRRSRFRVEDTAERVMTYRRGEPLTYTVSEAIACAKAAVDEIVARDRMDR